VFQRTTFSEEVANRIEINAIGNIVVDQFEKEKGMTQHDIDVGYVCMLCMTRFTCHVSWWQKKSKVQQQRGMLCVSMLCVCVFARARVLRALKFKMEMRGSEEESPSSSVVGYERVYSELLVTVLLFVSSSL
jgi:hypothetical protein